MGMYYFPRRLVSATYKFLRGLVLTTSEDLFDTFGFSISHLSPSAPAPVSPIVIIVCRIGLEKKCEEEI